MGYVNYLERRHAAQINYRSPNASASGAKPGPTRRSDHGWPPQCVRRAQYDAPPRYPFRAQRIAGFPAPYSSAVSDIGGHDVDAVMTQVLADVGSCWTIDGRVAMIWGETGRSPVRSPARPSGLCAREYVPGETRVGGELYMALPDVDAGVMHEVPPPGGCCLGDRPGRRTCAPTAVGGP